MHWNTETLPSHVQEVEVYANGLETVRVKWYFFTLLRNGLLRYILYTCPQLNVTRVQSATEWTASVHTLHMSAT